MGFLTVMYESWLVVDYLLYDVSWIHFRIDQNAVVSLSGKSIVVIATSPVLL